MKGKLLRTKKIHVGKLSLLAESLTFNPMAITTQLRKEDQIYSYRTVYVSVYCTKSMNGNSHKIMSLFNPNI